MQNLPECQSTRFHRTRENSKMSARRVIVSDESLEMALCWLRDHAEQMGAAKERLVRAEHMLKHIKALEMKRHDLPVSAQEREALASKAYREAIEEEAKAAGAYEVMRSLREAAALKIEAWRSEQANFRAMKI
jgi:hypothetical protein